MPIVLYYVFWFGGHVYAFVYNLGVHVAMCLVRAQLIKDERKPLEHG